MQLEIARVIDTISDVTVMLTLRPIPMMVMVMTIRLRILALAPVLVCRPQSRGSSPRGEGETGDHDDSLLLVTCLLVALMVAPLIG